MNEPMFMLRQDAHGAHRNFVESKPDPLAHAIRAKARHQMVPPPAAATAG